MDLEEYQAEVELEKVDEIKIYLTRITAPSEIYGKADNAQYNISDWEEVRLIQKGNLVKLYAQANQDVIAKLKDLTGGQ